MDELITWLHAQVSEDDRRNPWPWWAKGQIRATKRRARIGREITAKRWILAQVETSQAPDDEKRRMLAPIAYVYADRPGYKREWAP